MSADISYWLSEVESLQRQLQSMGQERDTARQDADNWRQRYETEALQRRRETQSLQGELRTLRETIAQLQAQADLTASESDNVALPAAWLAPEVGVPELQTQLQSLWQERDRYRQALAEERRAHHQTRQNLTLALGDAVDQLKRMKGGQD